MLLAALGVQGPPDVIESRDGFMQAFAFGRIDRARPIVLPPAAAFGITDCYIKPYACCRHIQPAVEALIALCNEENIAAEEVTDIDVDTYRIAAEHAHTGWDDYASAQLSFPYLIGVALRFRAIRLEHFADEMRRQPAFDGHRTQAARRRDAGGRPALSAIAAGAGQGDDGARRVRPRRRRGARLAPGAARR